MKEVTYKLNVETKSAVKEVDELNNSIKETGKDSKSAQDNLNTITGGAVGRFNALKTNVLGVVKSFKSLRVAIIASGVGALVLAVVSLGQAFTRSEAGQNKFSKLMGVIGSIVNNLLDLLADFGESIISVFENPKQAIKDFANLIKKNIVNRFQGILELIPQLGKAVSLLFKGEFAEAGKVATNAVAKVSLGVDNIVEKTQAAINKTKEFTKELEEEAKIAAKIADNRAKADKIERANTVARAKADREIADLRFKAEQRDKFAVSERIKFLEQASALEEKITNEEIEAARLRFEAKKAENALGKSTKEDLNEQAQLEAQLIQLNTSKLRMQKRLQTSLTTFRNEEKADREAARKAEEDKQKAEQKRNKEKEKADKEARDKQKAADEKAKKEELERAKKQKDLLQELTNTAQEQEIYKLKQQYENKFELAKGNAELEKELKEKQNQDIAAINKKFRDEEDKAEEERKAKQIEGDKTINELKRQAVIDTLTTIGNLTQLFAGESEREQKKAFEVQKAVSISQGLISTYESAVSSYNSVSGIPVIGPALGFAAATAAVSAGLLNVNQIRKQKFQSTGGGTPPAPSPSTGGISSGGAPSQPQAPSFNVVGQSGFNQIAGALGQQQPVQAFVVASEVTTQQQLDNQIVSTATF